MMPLILVVLGWTRVDPVEVARLAVKNYQANQQVALRYSYTEIDDDNSKGPIAYEVSTVAGTPYERVVSRNGKPFTGEDEARETEKYEKAVAERTNESARSREKRLRNFAEQVEFLDEAPDAFDFKLVGEETRDGRDTLVFTGTPKPGFHPHSTRGKMFTKLGVKAWVDKREMQIVKVGADVTDEVSIGWFMARVGRGTHMEMEQRRLSNGTWVLKRLSVDGRARILLLDNKNWDEVVEYSNYR